MTIHKLDTKMYVAQKAFINKKDKVLVLRDPRYKMTGQSGIDFPGGKYRWAKNLHDELEREVKEETNLNIKIGKPFVTWTNYKHGEKYKTSTNVYSIGYLCEFASGEVNLSDEHDHYEWVDKTSYKKWKENTPYYQALEEYFRIINPGT